MSAAESILYSQGFNFESFAQKGVDPRTGQYTFSVDVYDAPAQKRNCPALTLSLRYNPLNTQDVGLGTGWSFNLSSYDPRNGKISLSNGENYKVTETTSAFFIQDQKLKSFKASKVGSDYEVAYKTGQIEVLSNANDTYDRSVPIAIYAENGRCLDLVWIRKGSQPRLSKIQGNGEDLVAIEYSDAQVTITRGPNSPDANTFTLTRHNAQLTDISLPSDDAPTWHFEYESFPSGFTCLSQVTTPSGLIEEVNYQAEGHQLPSGAPYSTIPYVISHVVRPQHQQPTIVTQYSYSSRNFLGFDGGRSWSPEGDTLYLVPDDYEYSATKQVQGGASTTYTYNKFHLSTQIVQQQNTKAVTNAITYHATPNTGFDDQPAQYQLPQSVSTTYADTASSQDRTETTTTDFDEWGNPTKEVKPDGLTTTRSYFDSSGEGDDCPADPHGFCRYLKTEIVTPADSAYPAPTRAEHFTYLQSPTADNARVDTFVALKQRTTTVLSSSQAQSDVPLSTAKYTYFNQPSSRDHGRIQQQESWVSTEDTATTQSFDYSYPSDDVFQTTLTTSSSDGVNAKDETQYSMSSGLLTAQTDEKGVQDIFRYDQLGRCVEATTTVGTAQEAARHIAYSFVQTDAGRIVLVTDAKGVQTQYITDGLERLCQVQKQDDDGSWDPSTNAYLGTFRPTKEYTYNALGQTVEITDIDWFHATGKDDPTELQVSKQMEYDDWGQVCKTTNTANGMITVSETDRIAMTRTEGIQGQGQVRTQLNLSGVPTQITLLQADGTQYGMMEYSYDGLGRLVEEKDALERTTQYEFDSYDRVSKTTGPGGRELNVQYASQSAAVLPTSVQLNGVTVGTQSYDGLDRVVQKTGGGRILQQSYQGSMPEPVQMTTNKGDALGFTFKQGLPDLLGKVTAPEGENDYDYEPSTGAVLQFKSSFSTRSRQYFPSGLLSNEKIEIGQEPAFSTVSVFSMGGRLQGYTDVHGQTYQHEYDTASRLSSLALGKLNVLYSYDAANRLSGTSAQDTAQDTNLASVLTYDDFGREIGRDVSQGQQLLFKLTQSYSETSLVTTRHLEDGNGDLLRDETFEYDENNRLSRYCCEGGQIPTDENGHEIKTQEYRFDDFDNMVSVTTGFQDSTQNTATFSYSQEDPTQLIQITNTHPDFPQEVGLTYDANGCLTQDDQGRTLEYDSGSRLKAVKDSSGTVISQYSYDAEGRLICQSIPNQPDTYLFYRDNKLIGSKTGDSQVSYLYDGERYWGQTMQTKNGTQTQLWASNSQNSVLGWVDPSQPDQVHAQLYTPYGFSAPESASSIGFNGQWRDPVTGWYHLGNGYRVYNPALGRFHVPDPASPFATGEINPYTYCAGDPVNRVDPSGQSSFFSSGFCWKDLITLTAGLITGIAAAILTGGASLAIQVGVGLAVGVATNVAAGALGDLADGRRPSWKSVATDALNGLVFGIIGEFGGRLLLTAVFDAVRAGSVIAERSLSAVWKDAVKEGTAVELVDHVSEIFFEIEPFPEESSEASESRSAGTASPASTPPSSKSPSSTSTSTAQQSSQTRGQSALVRQASLMRDPIRPLHRGPSAVPGRQGQQRSGGGPSAPNSPASILNRQIKCTFGPEGASQGKRQTTGSGALEALESKRRMYSALRAKIRCQQAGGADSGGISY